MEKTNNDLIKSIDNDMAPRFGHTITLVQKSKAVLFGGATGVEGRFSINSDTYVFYIESKKWVKLERNNILIQLLVIFPLQEQLIQLVVLT